MRDLDLTADELIDALLGLADTKNVCILDSCGVGHLGSHLLIAGFAPVAQIELGDNDAEATLANFEELLETEHAAVFTLSYDFGRALISRENPALPDAEPFVFVSLFVVLIIHDYDSGRTFLTGKEACFDSVEDQLRGSDWSSSQTTAPTAITSNFTRSEYIEAVGKIKELIRSGDTYQTNLTRRIEVELPPNLSSETIFRRLRKNHPAPFSAFIKRSNSTVISASPERFFKIEGDRISASPIKGTRPRGATPEQDAALRAELLSSEKDRAENTMIVDLLRNDLGRVCEYGSVSVEKLCEIEEHPSLYHLVSTISGTLRANTGFGEIVRSLFPCGSITGAPKIRTMEVIDEIETVPRGLSMGAIGYRIPGSFGIGESVDLSVAIRTMVIRDGQAVFNVGGGIVIDSDPDLEYEETVLKSRALMDALGIVE